jgi:hypothetical protein
MLIELKTFRAICDECGHQHQFVSDKLKYPLLWGKANRSEHVGTRMESAMCLLCPDCVAGMRHSTKYAKSTLHIFAS